MNSSDPAGIQETVELGDSGGRPPAAPRSAGPARIGKYEVVALLGRGGMGAVYRAFDPVLERDVALKVMLPQIAGDPEQKQRFEREARAVARLAHPSVVTVFDLGYHTDGSPYIVMELLKGRDLSAILRSGDSLSLERKASIVLQVLEGLGLAHKRGIVHRDVKPPNIFITDDQTAKIMDFGIARFTSGAATGTGSVLGTAAYMSPEQVRGERVDGRSDLFSTGIVLCELLTGRRPFEAQSAMAIMYQIAHDEPVIEVSETPLLEPFLPVLRRALAKKVEDRYPTAAEFAAALRLCLERPAMARGEAPAGERERAPGAVAPPVPVRPSAVTPTPPAEPRSDPSGIFRLLREIYTGSKSGHLHFCVGQGRKSLRILKGQIIHGTSDVEGEHLGDILVRYGLLDQADLERAVAVVLGQRKRLGVVLPELGILGRDKVEEAVGLHVREILFSALDSPGVSFLFEEVAESALEADLVCPLSTGEVILEATRRIQDPDLVKRTLGDTGRRLALSSDPLLRFQRISLTPTDAFVLSRIDGTLSAREIVGLIPLPAEDTERSLFSLLCTGVVGYAPETTNARRTSAGRPTRTPAPPRPDPSVTPPARGREGPASLPTRRTSTPVPSAAPDGAPPTPTPDAAQGRRTQRRSAEEIRQLVLEIHARLRHDHFEVLGLERSATAAQVKEAYAGFARVLHPDACRDPALDDLHDKRNAVFSRLTHAYETLRDPESRARYERDHCPKLQTPTPTPPIAAAVAPPSSAASPSAREPEGPPPEPRPRPESALRSAERLFQEGKYWDVIQQLEPLIPHLDEPSRSRARSLLARTYMKNPLWTKRAAQVLQQVVQVDPRYVEAYLLLGEIYSKAHLQARARAMYNKALEIDPENPQAQKDLAALVSESPS